MNRTHIAYLKLLATLILTPMPMAIPILMPMAIPILSLILTPITITKQYPYQRILLLKSTGMIVCKIVLKDRVPSYQYSAI